MSTGSSALTNAHGIEFVELADVLVAGLPVRSPKRPLGSVRDLNLERAWADVLRQDPPGPWASLYTDHAVENASYYTQIVGYRCSAEDEIPRGYLIGRAPGGRYAHFVSTGDFPGVVTGLWDQVRDAEESCHIVRAFTGDFEFYPNAFRIDLYVSVGPADEAVTQ